MTVGEVIRSLVLTFGAVLMGLTLAMAYLYSRRWRDCVRRGYEAPRLRALALARLGSAMGIMLLELELTQRLTYDELTYRAPAFALCYLILGASFVGILRNDEQILDRARREGDPCR